MKRIFKTLALALAGLFVMASCEDVPAPYRIGHVPDSGESVIVEPEGEGTLGSPFNVAAAINLAKGLQRSNSSESFLSDEVFVKGIVSKLGEFSAQHGNYTYFIVDEGSDTELEVYRGRWLNGANFTDADQLQVGDTVIVQGQLQNWLGTLEFTAGSLLIYHSGGEVEPSEQVDPAGEGTYENPYNVAAVHDLYAKGEAEGKTVYVKGIVTRIKSLEVPKYKRAQYYISDDGKKNNEFYIFNGYYLNRAEFTSNDQLQAGDTVVVCGTLIIYEDQKSGSKTNEMAADNYLTYINGQWGDAPQPHDDNNTIDNPYTVDEAVELIMTGKYTNDEVYVKGFVTSISEISLEHGNATYMIGSNNQEANNQLQVYRGKALGGEDFTSDDDLLVGDEVIVLGKLKLFQNQTPEMDAGNKIVWLNGQTPEEPEPGDVQGDGTLENPFNIPAANAYIAAGQNLDQKVYVEGIISEIKSLDVSRWQRAQYYISNDGTTAGQFLIYNGYYLGGADFTSNDQIKVGDRVIVLGNLKNFQGTNEMDSNNKIVCLNGQWAPDEPEPGPTPGGEGDIAFTSDDISAGASGSVSLVSNAYGQQAVATKSTWYTFTAGGIEWTGCRMCIAPDSRGGGIQIQGNASDPAKQGFMYNTSALPEMKTIVITAHVDAGSQYGPSFNVYIGTSENPSNAIQGSQSKTTQGGLDVYTFTYDVSSTSSTYMKIWNNLQGALYLDKVEFFKK